MCRGLFLTGTSGAGKTTLAKVLQQKHTQFRQVKAVTTRQQRDDDSPGSYRGAIPFCGLQFSDYTAVFAISAWGSTLLDIGRGVHFQSASWFFLVQDRIC